MKTFGNALVPHVGDCPSAVVMKTFGNVAGHTGHGRRYLFTLEAPWRLDVRGDNTSSLVPHVGDWPDRSSTWKM
jgi:hypothetical protein